MTFKILKNSAQLSLGFCFILILTGISNKALAVGDSATLSYESSIELKMDSLIEYAQQFKGVRYIHGGSSKQGFDCSGFTKYVYKHFGYSLPRSSRDYSKFGKKIPLNEAKKGDILVFKGSNIKSYQAGHVGIVVSKDDNGLVFIHSASGNRRGVVETNLNYSKYYKPRLLSVRRVVE
jgi:cell wall-associated NlpC family hydrolase